METIKKKNKILVVAKKEFKEVFRGIKGIIMLIILMGLFVVTFFFQKGLSEFEEESIEGQKKELYGGAQEFIGGIFTSPVLFTLVISSFLILFILISSYNSISEEKKSGSLKILLSFPLYRDEVLNGKILGRAFAFFCMIVFSSIFICIFLIFYGFIPNIDTLIRILLFFFFTFFLILMYVSFGILIGVLMKKGGGGGLGIILIFWLFFNIAFPILITILSSKLYPVDFYSGGDNLSSYELSDKSRTQLQKQQLFEKRLGYLNFKSLYPKMINNIFFYTTVHGDIETSPFDEVFSNNIIYMCLFLSYSILFVGLSYLFFLRMDVT